MVPANFVDSDFPGQVSGLICICMPYSEPWKRRAMQATQSTEKLPGKAGDKAGPIIARVHHRPNSKTPYHCLQHAAGLCHERTRLGVSWL